MAELDAPTGSSGQVPQMRVPAPPLRELSPRLRELSPRVRVPVLLVISSLEHGGAQRQVVQLANHLDPNRFEVHVCALSQVVSLAAGLRQPEVTAARDREAQPLRSLVLSCALAELMRALGVRIAHAFLFDAEMAVRLAAKLAHVPVVVSSERNSDYRRPAAALRLPAPYAHLVRRDDLQLQCRQTLQPAHVGPGRRRG